MEDHELTPDEHDALKALRRDDSPDPGLEDRTVAALRASGLLRTSGRRVIAMTPIRYVAAIAAVLVLFVSGFGLGRMSGAPDVEQNGGMAFASDPMSAAASLQQAGMNYTRALERFAAIEDTSGTAVLRQGREVALHTLYSAANQVARIVPREYLARQFLLALEVADTEGRDAQAQLRAVQF